MNEHNPKIYLLPNLMTAGNLFCGFAATLKIVQGALIQWSSPDEAATLFHAAVWFILGACIFDVLDGRLARLGGQDSAFGREFDSLADIVSFGVAPALMVYRIVLIDFPRLGWLVAFVYLVCGALRLARYNCVSAAGGSRGRKSFHGFSHSRCCRLNRIDYTFYALVVRRTRSFDRHLEMGASAFNDLSFNHDV